MPGSTENKPAIILVVDDNEANRLLAKETLEDEGYRVALAAGGAEGIAAFERERPDCVVLDVRMPGLDGFAVCERIRALPQVAHTPILFLTALRDIDTFDQALRAGGDDFLTKPIRPAELVARVQTALKLRRMGNELLEHVALLRHQRDDLMRLQLQKERLTAFVVHDLKNPVSSIDLHAQLLLRERGMPEAAREAASQIRADARQLNRMILNLLDVSKAEEGKLSPRRAPIDLRPLLDGVVAELETSAQTREVKLSTSFECERVSADNDLLRRVLSNLVENAIRHAPPGSVVTVACSSGAEGVELRVIDGGSGIPLELRERIFDPFVQVEAASEHASRTGRGLGLAFCKLAVQAHGGRIWVEDAAPGAAFCVRLPDDT